MASLRAVGPLGGRTSAGETVLCGVPLAEGPLTLWGPTTFDLSSGRKRARSRGGLVHELCEVHGAVLRR